MPRSISRESALRAAVRKMAEEKNGAPGSGDRPDDGIPLGRQKKRLRRWGHSASFSLRNMVAVGRINCRYALQLRRSQEFAFPLLNLASPGPGRDADSDSWYR